MTYSSGDRNDDPFNDDQFNNDDPPMTDEERQKRYNANKQREINERNQRLEQEARARGDERQHDQCKAALDNGRSKMDLDADKGIAAKAHRSIKKKSLQRLEKQTPNYVHAGAITSLGHFLLVLAAIAVVCINYFLINAPVGFLASQAFEDMDSWQSRLTTVLVPIILLIFELSIALLRKKAKQDNDRLMLARWGTLGAIMICITPLLILGTMFANPEWGETYSLFLSLGMMVLAGVTDALIIFGGENIVESLTFVYFKIDHWNLNRQINHYTKTFTTCQRHAVQVYNQFAQRLEAYNHKHPQRPLDAGMFRASTARFVNEAAGQVVIMMPNIDPDDPPEPQARPRRPQPNPPNPGAAAPAPGPPTPAQEAVNNDDYYQQMLQNQARRNDREVH